MRKQIKRVALILVAIILMIVPCFSVFTTEIEASVSFSEQSCISNLEFFYRIRNEGYTLYNIPQKNKTFLYTDYKLKNKTTTYVKENAKGEFKLLDVNKQYKSVYLQIGNRKMWMPISFITDTTTRLCYPYQITCSVNCYASAGTSKYLGTLKPKGTTGTSENDVMILSTTQNYVRIAVDSVKRIVYVPKKTLYSAPLANNGRYYFCPNYNSSNTSLYISSGAYKGQRLYLQKADYRYDNTSLKDRSLYSVTYYEGWYRIYKVGSNLYWDVAGASRQSGTSLQLYPSNGTTAQYFQIFFKNGRYYIRSMLGTYVDIPGCNIRQGVYLQMYTGNNTAAQWWNVHYQ